MNKLKTNKTLNLKTRIEWRNWLQQNFNIENEVWLVYAKKSSGEQRIQYNDAVEEALCFGWIDGTNKTLDKGHTIQRFAPRQTKSTRWGYGRTPKTQTFHIVNVASNFKKIPQNT